MDVALKSLLFWDGQIILVKWFSSETKKAFHRAQVSAHVRWKLERVYPSVRGWKLSPRQSHKLYAKGKSLTFHLTFSHSRWNLFFLSQTQLVASKRKVKWIAHKYPELLVLLSYFISLGALPCGQLKFNYISKGERDFIASGLLSFSLLSSRRLETLDYPGSLQHLELILLSS